MSPVPFPVDRDRRMEHWHLIGSSGWGKSQTLQHIIMHDLLDPDPPALVVVDSQGDMLEKIQRLELFARDPDRLIIIDPEYDPSLNMFDVATDRLAGYSPIVREQVQAGIIELYTYIFGAVASELTAKQGTAFAFVVRLMLSIPGATLHTLIDLMEDPSKSFAESPFAAYGARLDKTARSFFDNQFFNKQAFGSTRQQIARRLLRRPLRSRVRPHVLGEAQQARHVRRASGPKGRADQHGEVPSEIRRLGALRPHDDRARHGGRFRARRRPLRGAHARIPHHRRGGRIFRRQP